MTREEINHEKQKEIYKEQNKEKIKKIIKLSIKIILIILVLVISFLAYTTYISTTKIIIKEYRITDNKIPDNFNGLKIIQFSDLHYGSTMFYENLNKIKTEINKRKPDIIIFTGDLIYKDYKISSEEKEKLSKILNSFESSLGKYAILGDEDEAEEITTILNQGNFITLKNEYDLIYNETNEPILLIGLSSLLTNEQDIQKGYEYFNQATHNSDIYTITITHEPDSANDIINTYNNTDLLLTGHSHNGYIKIPIIDYPLERKEGSKKYPNEHYKINDTDLYVSSGLGTTNNIGIRLFCRPSINFYRLSNK